MENLWQEGSDDGKTANDALIVVMVIWLCAFIKSSEDYYTRGYV